MEGQGRSLKVMEGQGMLRNVKEGRSWKLFSHHSVDISGEESYEWGWGGGGL